VKIARAHDYAAVEKVRFELERVPSAWLSDATPYKWFILPSGLSPVWIGLVTDGLITHDGRQYREVGGWCAGEQTAWCCRETPHIFLTESSAWAAVHELGHALEEIWHAPVDELFRPECALDPYAASNPAEYFACAVDAFLHPVGNEHLAEADPQIWMYLESKL
jgi:hypothetical protein